MGTTEHLTEDQIEAETVTIVGDRPVFNRARILQLAWIRARAYFAEGMYRTLRRAFAGELREAWALAKGRGRRILRTYVPALAERYAALRIREIQIESARYVTRFDMARLAEIRAEMAAC